jgi:hypothetical protein
MSAIPFKTSSKSSITNLSLIGMHESCFVNRLTVLLQYFPYLHSLNIVAHHLDFPLGTTTKKNLNSTIPILSFTLNVNDLHVPFAQFSSFIMDIMTPHIEELTIISRTALEDLTYLDRW